MNTQNYISVENRIENAIKIFNYCFQNNVSINKAELDLGFYEGFIKKIFISNSIKESSRYFELVELRNKYNSLKGIKTIPSIVHRVDVDKEEKYDNRSTWIANRDEDNKIIDYSFTIYVQGEKPFVGKLTREQLETIHQYYPHVTMMNVSSYFPYLTFQQFKRVIRCFNITKDMLFPLHILEEHTDEEIAEFALKNKASASLNKIVEKRSSFIEKKYFESQEKIHDLKNIQKFIEDSIEKYYTREETNELSKPQIFGQYTDICYLMYSDIHYGKKYSNPGFGRGYNKDIAHERMMQIAKKTVDYIRFKNLKVLYILFGGDMYESIMTGGMRAEHLKSMDITGIDQLIFGVDSQIEFLNELRIYLGDEFPIVVTYIGGNHDRIGKDRDDDQERTGSLIAYHMIEREFKNDDFIRFNIPRKQVYVEKHQNHDMNDLCIIAHHGDAEIIKKKGHELVNLYGIGTSGYHLVVNGHWHSSEISFNAGTNYMEISLPSVCSVDEFILDRLGNNQLPGFLLGICENSGFSFTNEVLY
jgi:ubiquinone biosynthesis protein COQ9